jgi:hypothetical protein
MQAVVNAFVHNKVNNDIIPNKFEQSSNYSYQQPLQRYHTHKRNLLAEKTCEFDAMLRVLGKSRDLQGIKQMLLDTSKTKRKQVEADFDVKAMSVPLHKALVQVTKENIVWCDVDTKCMHMATKLLKEDVKCHWIATKHGGVSAFMHDLPFMQLVDHVVKSGFATSAAYEAMPVGWLKAILADRDIATKGKKKVELVALLMAAGHVL